MRNPKDIVINGVLLDEILILHKKWLNNEPNGVHAYLRSAYLSSADLSNANLRNANLRNADLSNADLSNADLSNADLSNANLSNANLNTKNIISVSRIGSSKRMTTYDFDNDKIWCGCFIGTLQEFEIKVNKTHKDNIRYLTEYLEFIKYLKTLKKLYEG